MTSPFSNVYEDARRAQAYAGLEFPGTYYLAFRDLPDLLRRHAPPPGPALDFGCGAGRSTRFLAGLACSPLTGVDISADMLACARERDPGGDYRQVPDGDLAALPDEGYSLILSAFTFDNVPTPERKCALFRDLRRLLRPGGRLFNLVSSPEIYRHEWASFSTRDFPENRGARSGERVRIVMLDVPDRRPVEDILCTDEEYRALYEQAGLSVLDCHRPLGREEDSCAWVSEKLIAPWVIWVLESST